MVSGIRNHCMGHCLNLAVQDKKKAMLLKLKSEKSPGVKPLCPTRWTVRAESLRSILLNYEVIQGVLEEILEVYSGNTEATSTARGILVTSQSLFLFFLQLQLKNSYQLQIL